MLRKLGALCLLTFLPAGAQVLRDSTDHAAILERLGHIGGPIQGVGVDSDSTTVTSTNWSGYAVTGAEFTSARGSWVVPAVVCAGVSKQQFAANWVGIDGFNDQTVEQLGTLSICDTTTPVYAAWYEFYPANLVELSLPVNPGNVISASVVFNGGTFTLKMTNQTSGESTTKTGTLASATRASAEWIMEAPADSAGILPLPDFGTTTFGFDYTKVANTNNAKDSTEAGNIGTYGAKAMRIRKISSSSSPQTSTCTLLSSDGSSFSCKWAK